MVIGVTSLVTAGVLVLSGLGYVVYDKLTTLPICGEAANDYTLDVPIELLTTAKAVCTDPVAGLDYTAPVTGLTNRDFVFDFPTKLSREDAAAAQDVPKEDLNSWGFQLFGDAGLTVELPFWVGQSDDGWEVGPTEDAWYDAYYYPKFQETYGLEQSSDRFQLRDNFETVNVDGEDYAAITQWGFRDVYYLVRYVDDKGRALERPLVSEFRFEHELTTPDVSVGTDPESPGTLMFEWTEVPGAESYAIVVGNNTLENGVATGFRKYEIVGVTSETTWSANEAFAAELNDPWLGDYRPQQNASLELFEFSDDYSFDPAVYGGWDIGDYEYGVVAVGKNSEGDRIASAYGAIDALGVAATGAFAFAQMTWLDTWGGQLGFGTEFASFDDIPTTVPMVTLDGKIVDAPAVLVGATLLRADDAVGPGFVSIGLFAAGTQLGFPVFVPVPRGQDALNLVDQFNERSLYDSPLAGEAEATIGHYVLSDAVLLDAAPRVDFPVHEGSHPFVTYLATQFVARTEGIDISKWLGQPGLPDVWDAVDEAMRQNPYAYVQSVSASGDVIYVSYSYDEAEYEQHQAELKSAVEQAVGGIIKPGASARDKAKAINAYLVNNAEYDYTALGVLESYSGSDWRAYALDTGQMHAWEANGAFREHLVVCAGYSIAFEALAMEVGLPVEYVSGVVSESGGRHAWTKVQIDGTWYAIDSTWNDSSWGNKWLLIRDSQFTTFAARTEDNYWILDANQGWFATP